MNIKADILLIFVGLLVLTLAVFYVGTVSDTLSFAKAVEQLVYFLTGRTSSGGYATTTG